MFRAKKLKTILRRSNKLNPILILKYIFFGSTSLFHWRRTSLNSFQILRRSDILNKFRVRRQDRDIVVILGLLSVVDKGAAVVGTSAVRK